MDNPEKLATLGTQDTRRRQIDKTHTTTRVGHYNAQDKQTKKPICVGHN